MEAPLITIFVRHSADCKYVGDEFCKRCNCKKHLRWSQRGKQFRKATGARSWAGAEDSKAGAGGATLRAAPARNPPACYSHKPSRLSKTTRRCKGIKVRVLSMYKRELKRLLDFSESRGLFTVKRALTIDNLIALRATWTPVYRSSYSRATVQKHLNHFLRFCYNAGWIDRIPKLSPIKIDEPETEPLTDEEYNKILGEGDGQDSDAYQAHALERPCHPGRIHAQTHGPQLSTKARTSTESSGSVRRRENRFIFPSRRMSRRKYLRPSMVIPCMCSGIGKKPIQSEYRHAGYMGEQVAAAFTAAGVESAGHMISHRLRATFAVDLLTKGVPLEHVSKLLGHRSVTTTERHYARWVKGRQDRLDALVSATWAK